MLVPRPPLSLTTTVRAERRVRARLVVGQRVGVGQLRDGLDLGLAQHARLAGAQALVVVRERLQRDLGDALGAHLLEAGIERIHARHGTDVRPASSSDTRAAAPSARRSARPATRASAARPRDRSRPARAARLAPRSTPVARQVLDAERLVRERHVHHRGRVALGGGEVHDAPLREQVQAPRADLELLDERQHLAARPTPARRAGRRRSRRRSDRRWRASRRPSCARSARRTSTSRLPVTVMKTSPRSAASSAGMTSQPSIRASSARIGSTSQTTTDAPAPFARSATPLPVQP